MLCNFSQGPLVASIQMSFSEDKLPFGHPVTKAELLLIPHICDFIWVCLLNTGGSFDYMACFSQMFYKILAQQSI